jgi:hypothetical protein
MIPTYIGEYLVYTSRKSISESLSKLKNAALTNDYKNVVYLFC